MAYDFNSTTRFSLISISHATAEGTTYEAGDLVTQGSLLGLAESPTENGYTTLTVAGIGAGKLNSAVTYGEFLAESATAGELETAAGTSGLIALESGLAGEFIKVLIK